MHTDNDDDLLAGLVSHVLARPILIALAATGAQRYTDLMAGIVTVTAGPVHSKTFDSALRYLLSNGLVTRTTIHPRSTVYAITEFGRELAKSLGDVQAVIERHRSNPTQTAANGSSSHRRHEPAPSERRTSDLRRPCPGSRSAHLRRTSHAA